VLIVTSAHQSRYTGQVRVFTNLNLHGNTPLRIQPGVGEWGPQAAMSTRRKRRGRWLWIVAFVVVVTLLFVFGHWVYGMIMTAGT